MASSVPARRSPLRLSGSLKRAIPHKNLRVSQSGARGDERREAGGCLVGRGQALPDAGQDGLGLGVGEAAVTADERELLQEASEGADHRVRAAVVVVLAEDDTIAGVEKSGEVGFGGDEVTEPGDEGDAFGGGVQGSVKDAADQGLERVFGEGGGGHAGLLPIAGAESCRKYKYPSAIRFTRNDFCVIVRYWIYRAPANEAVPLGMDYALKPSVP